MKLITALATPFLHGKIHLESFVIKDIFII